MSAFVESPKPRDVAVTKLPQIITDAAWWISFTLKAFWFFVVPLTVIITLVYLALVIMAASLALSGH